MSEYVKHWQLPVPWKPDSSRTVHANPIDMHTYGKLQMRRIHLQCWNRGLWRVWDVLTGWSSFPYCFDIVSLIFPPFLHRFYSFFLPFVWALFYFYLMAVSRVYSGIQSEYLSTTLFATVNTIYTWERIPPTLQNKSFSHQKGKLVLLKPFLHRLYSLLAWHSHKIGGWLEVSWGHPECTDCV